VNIIATEQLIVASVLSSETHDKPGTCVCTALAYWPYWESPEASKLAEGITKCIHKGWRLKPKNIKVLLEPDYKPWVDHPIFGPNKGLPFSCVEGEARALLPHYKSKRITEIVGRAHTDMLAKPEAARTIALSLKLQLGDWL
jgi:hypothetical protein